MSCDQADAMAMATLVHFYGDILEQDLVYLVTSSHRIPVKMDAMLPKGQYYECEDVFVGSPTAIREFMEKGRIVPRSVFLSES